MGAPKPLVQFGSRTFLESVVTNFKAAGIANIVVVLGHEAESILQRLDLSAVRVVVNRNYKLGQFSSFQTGVRSLQKPSVGTFLALVDQPQIHSRIIRRILTHVQSDPGRIVVPTFKGKKGHPPFIPGWLFEEIRTAPVSTTASELIRRHADRVYQLEIDDESILLNINTRQDLYKVQKTKGDVRREGVF